MGRWAKLVLVPNKNVENKNGEAINITDLVTVWALLYTLANTANIHEEGFGVMCVLRNCHL